MELSEEQQKLIDRVAVQNGFSDYKLVKSPGSIKGDNFLGILTAITLTDEEKTLDLILKSAHKNETFRKTEPIHLFYEREIYMYKRVFEEFKKFQQNNIFNSTDIFNSTAKLYGYCIEDSEECLLMENLKTVGYQLWDKRVPMNPEHVRAVLVEYAKFHAVSFAMKQKNPKLFDDLVGPIYKNVIEESDTMNTEEKLNVYVKTVMQNGYRAMKDDAVLTECLKRIETKAYEVLSVVFKKEEYKLVISHGDCWCNNFLFKYQDFQNESKLSSLRIIDWQISTVTSPANDVSYFLFANSSKLVLENYEIYLKLYHDTLSDQLRNFGCNPEEIYPYSIFENHFKIFAALGAHTSMMIFKLMNTESEETPDFAQELENDNFVNQLSFDIKNFAGYYERLKIMLKVLNDNNLV